LPLEKGNEALAQLLEEAKYGDRSVHMGEIAVTTARGQSLLLEVTTQRREWGRNTVVTVLVIRDASEKRRIREEIRRADQLAFLGGMAARVAHEIRTPMATIRGLLELLQADLSDGDSRRQYIDRVLQGVERQNRLVENLLTLSHPEPETLQSVAVPELLQELVGMPPRDPRLRVDLGAAAPPATVWGDPFRLSEVFTNLVDNALQASPPSGVVEVRLEAAGSERVQVRVRNTGAGIPVEMRERIFQPFFTTKTKGTGLGLAIARQIVEAHRGTIRVESDGHSETTFIVELPTTAPVLAAGSP
jgi:signal transduction histidine kinase